QKYQDLLSGSKDEERIAEMASAHNALGNIYWKTQQYEQVNKSHFKAVKALLAFSPPDKSSPRIKYELARSYYYLGRKNMRSMMNKGPRPKKGKLNPEPTTNGSDEKQNPEKQQPAKAVAGNRVEEKYLFKAIDMLEEL